MDPYLRNKSWLCVAGRVGLGREVCLADVPVLGYLKWEATFVAHPGSELVPVLWPPADLPCCEASEAALLSWTVSSAAIQRSTQNWYGLWEPDCLIKTKHCDGPKGVEAM